jgi:glucokinase
MLKKYLIGVDVGGTKIYAGLVSPCGEIVQTLKVPTPPGAGARGILLVLYRIIKDILRQGRVPLKNVLGIGVAIPGVVDGDGRVVVTPNISLTGTELKKILIKKYKKRVAVGNDVNFGVLGECWLGAGRKANNIVGIFPGTGVGGGVVASGRLLEGTQGAAAELGHVSVVPDGPKCTCGNAGCLEALAGRWAIERDIRAAVAGGTKSLIMDIAGRDLGQIKSGALKKALQAKDPLVSGVIRRAAEALGSACVSFNHIFNPEVFIFGGGLVESCGDYILPVVERSLSRDPFFKRLATPRVLMSKLGDDAVMLGAVAAVRGQCVPAELKDVSYYPKLRVTPAGKIAVKDRMYGSTFYIRADGKVKEPGTFFLPPLKDDDLEDVCKKGPDALIVACGRGRSIGFSPKALKFLRKKKITASTMPLADAVKLYNTSEDRRALLVFF